MASANSIASVYARAAFEAAGDDAPLVNAELAAFVAAITDDPEVWETITAPDISSVQRIETFDKVFAQAHSATRGLFHALVENGRLELIRQVVSDYAAIVREQERKLTVTITTAVTLPAALRSKLEEKLSTSTGRDVTLEASVDPAIIGGMIARYDDTMVDASLRGRLDQLRLLLGHTSTARPSN